MKTETEKRGRKKLFASNKFFSFRVNEDAYNAFIAKCAENHTTATIMLRLFVDDYLKDKNSE